MLAELDELKREALDADLAEAIGVAADALAGLVLDARAATFSQLVSDLEVVLRRSGRIP